MPALSILTPVELYPPPTSRESTFASAESAFNAVALIASVAFRIVAVPVVPPRLRVVAAPPIFKVVAAVLKRVAEVCVVVRSPPLRAISPTVVILP